VEKTTSKMIRSAFFPGHCTVTWTIVVCEIAPDWAATMIEAVPRFGCVLLPVSAATTHDEPQRNNLLLPPWRS